MTRSLVALVAALLVAAAVQSPAPAHADPADQSGDNNESGYLAWLHQEPTRKAAYTLRPDSYWLGIGHSVCADLAAGANSSDLIDSLQDQLQRELPGDGDPDDPHPDDAARWHMESVDLVLEANTYLCPNAKWHKFG
jgi:Protein of unknown function (DUF732)